MAAPPMKPPRYLWKGREPEVIFPGKRDADKAETKLLGVPR